jgi:hypothetical protein
VKIELAVDPAVPIQEFWQGWGGGDDGVEVDPARIRLTIAGANVRAHEYEIEVAYNPRKRYMYAPLLVQHFDLRWRSVANKSTVTQAAFD